MFWKTIKNLLQLSVLELYQVLESKHEKAIMLIFLHVSDISKNDKQKNFVARQSRVKNMSVSEGVQGFKISMRKLISYRIISD